MWGVQTAKEHRNQLRIHLIGGATCRISDYTYGRN